MAHTKHDAAKNYSADWWTPPEWMQWVRDTLGGEPFDPCPRDWDGSVDGRSLQFRFGQGCYVNHPGARERGNAQSWWMRLHEDVQFERLYGRPAGAVWCAFAFEQLRMLRPSPLELRGWLVAPRRRVPFVWGGPDMTTPTRYHGKLVTSPSNWAVWWTNVDPAEPPEPSIVVRTGGTIQW